ncbi:hypothetical protein [Neobacillus sp. YIM B06451]|uniref:hypothetical protein n=1 Tax=Neobacillus TaxID=2675232 RepID=UPI00292E2F0F|nr:hypothetical protein [Neobacillus sp. YIM B06451]
MYWETLPGWVWGVYYLYLLLTLGVGILNVSRKRILTFSVITIVLSITVPIISVLNSIGRAEGINEFEHLVAQLQRGSIWSIYVVIGFIYLFAYWAVIIIKNKRNAGIS